MGVFYRPPTADDQCLINLHNTIGQLHPRNLSNLILCGDFNGSPSSTPIDQLSTDFCLTQIVKEPTRITTTTSSIIDLVFLSAPDTLLSHSILPPVNNSDHYSISLSVRLPANCPPSHATRTIWVYKKADFDLGNKLLKNLPMATESDDIDVYWAHWQHCAPCATLLALT